MGGSSAIVYLGAPCRRGGCRGGRERGQVGAWDGRDAEGVGFLVWAELGEPGHIVLVILGAELLVELGHGLATVEGRGHGRGWSDTRPARGYIASVSLFLFLSCLSRPRFVVLATPTRTRGCLVAFLSPQSSCRPTRSARRRTVKGYC